jgi:hypothetical protein
MGVLKDQMISEMRLRGYAEKTIKCYTSCVQTLARHFMRSPKSIERDDIEAFFRELRVEKKSVATIHIYYEALKYFYRMHNQAYKLPLLSFRNINNRTPVILSKERYIGCSRSAKPKIQDDTDCHLFGRIAHIGIDEPYGLRSGFREEDDTYPKQQE